MYWKKYILLFSSCVLFLNCTSSYDKALRSTDKDFIYSVADKEFNNKKYARALSLYEYGAPYFSNSDSAATISYNSAYCNYEIKSYTQAASQFKKYYEHFSNGKKREEALYMAGYCYYLGSPPYNLDQTSTYDAINELQFFLEKYPNSDKTTVVTNYIKELRQKLENKSFQIGETYYKIFNYKAAIVSFSNMLEEFPDTYLKENAYLYLMRSHYELATQSILSKKRGRLKEAILQTEAFLKKFPDSKYKDEAERIKKKLTEELSFLKEIEIIAE